MQELIAEARVLLEGAPEVDPQGSYRISYGKSPIRGGKAWRLYQYRGGRKWALIAGHKSKETVLSWVKGVLSGNVELQEEKGWTKKGGWPSKKVPRVLGEGLEEGKKDPETAEWLETFVLKVVEQAYRAYSFRRSGPEPCISVSYLLDDLQQHSLPLALLKLRKKDQRNRIQAACKRLVKRGKLATSLGIGLRRKEVTCYAPA